MERLEPKIINGRTYYYYSTWGWKDGKCRRLGQKYLGKLQDIARACEATGPPPLYAQVFAWGLPLALYQEAQRAQVTQHVDQLCPKRAQGLSTGDYLRLAALNRATHPVSKQGMWEWFSRTWLARQWPEISAGQLASQRFWDHMDQISPQKAQQIWQRLIGAVIQRESIDWSQICYDGTNFYTFIDTFNVKSPVARRGKNKQGRHNLRQISYALFCSTDGHLPLFYEVYEGNRNDAKEFAQVLERFEQWFTQQIRTDSRRAQPTLVFDKGNNSADNFALVDKFQLHYVGSVKLSEHPELAQVSNQQDPRWQACAQEGWEGTKSWRQQAVVYGKQRTLVVTYNQRLFQSQWATVQNDLSRALEQLGALGQKLQKRQQGLLRRGPKPTVATVERQCREILRRQHLSQLVRTTVTQSAQGVPQLEYVVPESALEQLADTHLGKTLLITSHAEWTDAQVIGAYRSQFIIEEVFQEMKDRQIGSWWPLYHWTDSKIQVHGLYCTIALLLRALLWRRVRQAGIKLCLKRLLSELDQIQKVVNFYRPKRARQPKQVAVLTKRSEVQEKLLQVLELSVDK